MRTPTAMRALLAVWLVALLALKPSVAADQESACVQTAADSYPAAAAACDNAALVKRLISSGKWDAAASAELDAALRTTAAQAGLYGAAAAFSPAAIKKYGVTKNATLFSPYCHQPPVSLQASDNVTCTDLGDIPAGGYNYTDATLRQTRWYTDVAAALPTVGGAGKFSGLYFDKGGGEIWMDTYSVPVVGADGKIVAITTADVRATERKDGGDAEGGAKAGNGAAARCARGSATAAAAAAATAAVLVAWLL